MADTNHAQAPIESDGISYRGIIWFLVILTATTLFCQALVWGMFEVMEHRVASSEAARAPLSNPIGHNPPAPNLLTNEPANLHEFHAKEDARLSTYGWAEPATQTAHIPVERAKDLVLQRGLPVRATAPAGPVATPAAK
jgi:hypothetical protein